MKKLNKREQELFNTHLEVFESELEASDISYLEIYNKLEALVTIEHSLSKLNELACNYPLTSRQEKRLENLEKEAIQIIESLGFKGETQNDPRGHAILIYLPSGKFNSWDGESYRIGIY